MNKINVQILEIESHDGRPFGTSGTMYFPVIVSENATAEPITAFISESLLRKAGVSTEELDSIVGSELSVLNSSDLDGVVTEPSERLQRVYDGLDGFLLLNAANGKLVKSELMMIKQREDAVKVRAEKLIAEQRERNIAKKEQALKRLLERRQQAQQKAALQPETAAVAETVAAENATEEPAAAQLETNEDIPF